MLMLFTISVLILLVYYVHNKNRTIHSYWKKKGIKGPKPKHIIGNIKTIWTKEESIIILSDRIYNEYPEEKVVGIYQGLAPTLIIRDPSIMKQVLVNDFASFVDRGIRISNEPYTKTLSAAEGDEWKALRKQLSPLFTIGKLKQMVPLINSCVDKYIKYLNTVTKVNTVHEIRVLSMKYISKVVTSVVFGIEVDTFVEGKTNFDFMAQKLVFPTGLQRLSYMLINIWPGFLNNLPIRVLSKEVRHFFLELVKDVVKEREGKPKVRQDFMDIMIEMKEQGKLLNIKDGKVSEMEITQDLITAQVMFFYAAGLETSSGTIAFLLYELANNPEIQNRCCREVDRVMDKHNGNLDYDALKELHYITMAFEETLRKYPAAPILYRTCVSDYTFNELNLTINKGTKILIPIISLQRDPKYYSDPHKFDPERFAPENKERVHDYYLPFGDGPRNCIGLRFARVQSLLGITHFLYKFRVSPSENTPKKLTFDPNTSVTLSTIESLWLNVEKRKK